MPACITALTAEVIDADTDAPVPGCREDIRPSSLFRPYNSAELSKCSASALLPAGRGSRRVRVRLTAFNGDLRGGANSSDGAARVDRLVAAAGDGGGRGGGGGEAFRLCREGGQPYVDPRLYWIKRDGKDATKLLVGVGLADSETACVGSFE